jgi:hypothetical protein
MKFTALGEDLGLCVANPDSLAQCGLTQQANQFRLKDSVGETPTAAVETTTLPGRSLMIGMRISLARNTSGANYEQ